MRTNMDTEGGSESEVPRSVQEDALEIEYDSSDHDLGVRVVEAVGTAAGIDGTEITTPLSNVIDPGALDSLFAEGSNGNVTFRFISYRVTVSSFEDGTGRIYVE
jgi:uncharacterized protein YidB (DUF937 family)